jgi:phage-related protein
MALAKFDFKYKNAWEDEIGFNTLVTQFESGKEQRRSKGPANGKRLFRLTFDKTTNYNNDAQAMWDFFIARKGRFESFLFDYKKADDTVEEVEVRFAKDSLSREAFLNKAYSFGLELIEVI